MVKMQLIIVLLILTWTLVKGSTNTTATPPDWLNTILPPNERTIAGQFFQPLHTYTFLYDAQIATGIPGTSKQHSGTRIQCLAELIFSTQTSCTLQLSHMRWGRLNRQIPNPKQIVPFEAFEEVPIHSDVQRTLALPVGFTYKDGVVNDVTFDGEESPWSSNVIRGVLNMLQVNLNPEHQVPTEARRLVNVASPNDPLLRSQAKQYRVQEKTLEGDCEIIYTVFNSSTNDEVDKLQIYKSVDFDKCRMRPEIKYNFRFADPCPYCRDGKGKAKNDFFKTSTLANYIVRVGRSGQWLVENVKYESEHIFSPYDPVAGVAVSYMNQSLVLLKSTNSTSSARYFNNPTKSDWGLLYALDWDIWKERFAMDGEEDEQLHYLRRMPYSDVKQEKRALVAGLIRALLSEMRTPESQLNEEAPQHLIRLVYAFRIFTKTELDDIYRELTAEDEGPWTRDQRKMIKDILPHVAAMCASRECVAHLAEKIRNGDVSPSKAAASLKCILSDRSISAKEIEELLRLTESDVVAQNFPLRQSLWLTVGSLMNGLCMPNEDILARQYREDSSTFCTRQLKENYIETLFNKFHGAQKWIDSVLYLKTIGNAGLDLSVFNLERIIRQADTPLHSNKIRAEAILALRQLKNVMPRKIQKILLPIVANRGEGPILRITSAYQLLQTMPDRATLDQIARMLYTDTSKQVTSFIYTYMHTLSKSTNPCEQRLVHDLKLALRHAQVDKFNLNGYSSMHYYDIYNRLYHSGVELELASVLANTSFLPKYISSTFHTNAMGFWHKYFFTLGIVQDGLEPLIRDWMLGKDGNGRVSDTGASGFRNELSALFTKLGIKPRINPETTHEPKLFVYMKFLDQDYALIPFIITDQQRQNGEGIIDLKQIWKDLQKGIQLNINEADLLAEIYYKIPTIVGLPLVWTIRVPLMYSIVGRVQATTTPENGTWKTLKVQADLKSSAVATVVTEMMAWSPVVNSGLRIISKMKLHTPINARFEIDRNSDPSIAKFSFKLPTGKKELLTLESRPVTVTTIWPPRPLKTWNEPDSVTIMSDDSTRTAQFKHCFGKNTFGVEICARGQYAKASDLVKYAPRCPLIGPEKILITSESTQGQGPTEISFKLSTKFYEKSNQTIRPSFPNWVDFPSDQSTSASSESNEQSTTPPAQRSTQESTHRQQYQVRKPWKHTVNLEIGAQGSGLLMADFVHHYDPNHLYGKEEWKLHSPFMPKTAVCMKSETLFPQPPFTVDDMQEIEKKKVLSSSKIIWGDEKCAGANYVSVQMQAYQPESHYARHRKDIDHILFERCLDNQRYGNCSPIMQYHHLIHSSDLTKYQFMIEHKNVPQNVLNYTLNLYEKLKHTLHSHSDTDTIGIGKANGNGKIFVDLELDPRNTRHGDLAIRSPNENVCFTDVPVPAYFPVLNLKYNRRKSMLQYATGYGERAWCHISRRKLRTFDGVEYSIPLSNCFHVLAKDCSSHNPDFVVLMRRASEDLKKELKIITTTHKVIMTSKPDNSVEIDINGQKYAAEADEMEELTGDNGQVLVRIVAMGPYVKVEFPQIKLYVYFDGYAVNIKLSHLYMGYQCGLCGHFNNEPTDEFRKPNFELEDDVRQFYSSWVINEPSGCTIPEPSCPDGRCPYRPFTDIEDKDPERTELQEKPVKKTRMFEMNSQVCFSVTPIDQCRLKTYAIQKETRQVQFACYERDEEEVDDMLNQLMTEDVITVTREASGIRNLDIPIKCAPLT